jgi:site-specific DNA recombinase
MGGLKLKTAIYCRVSTDLQEKEHTIESQLEALRHHAKDKGYEIVAEYTDEGYSGACLERPGLDRLRDAIRTRDFELVLFHSPDRLARKAIYQSLILEELGKAGIKPEFLNYPVDDTPESKMLLGMQGLFAEYERAKITERNRRGKMHWARQGALMGGYVPYGYRYVPRDREQGSRATLAIDEGQATVVRDMYHWLIEEHLPCRSIAKRLTELKILSQKGKTHWAPSTVNRMLKEEVYKGIFYYHRAEAVEPSFRKSNARYKQNKLTGRKIRPQKEWITVPVPAIVDEATWEAAQRQLHQNFLHSGRNNKRQQYLLRGLIRCSRCGATYVGALCHGRRNYHCNRIDYLATADGKRCVAGWIKAEPVEKTVWTTIVELMEQPNLLAEEYKRRLAQANVHDAGDQKRKLVESALKQVKTQQDRLTDAYVNKAMELPMYKAKMEELRTKQKQIENQMSELQQGVGQKLRNQEVLTHLKTFCETVSRGLDNLTFEEKQDLLRSLVERITVENNKVKIEVIISLDEKPSDSVGLCPQCIDSGAGYRKHQPRISRKPADRLLQYARMDNH